MNRYQSSRWAAILAVSFFILPMLQAFIPVHVESFEESTDTIMEASGRAQTTWSGTQSLSSTYTVAISDELIIQSCTVVQMSGAARIIVEGRLTVLGTQTCPVTLEASGLQDHEGIQFNSSSNGRGSVLQNLTITDSIYGMTIYGSNPVVENLTVVNPDRVAVDMFNNAAPRITDLYVNQAGRDLPFQGDWRYGIGLSIGAGSTPIVTRAVFSDILTRAVNIWGGSGGLIQGITVDNCSGSTYAMVAGIWVEDSQPLLTNISIDKSDTGIVVRHIDDGGYTHAVIRHASISNSMYRGVYVDKNNHTNYTNYETADFTNLTITGTGTSGAKTANIGYAALEVNATGAWFDDTLIEDSTTVGVRLYFVDDTTTFRNLTIRNSGDPGQGPHEAGLAIRSSFFAPRLEGVEISGSVGPGISSTSGGAMQGSDWSLHNNTEHGLYIDRATVVVNGLNLSNNQQSGAQVWDARYVTFENLSAHNNGGVASSNPLAQNQAGLYYEDSNDIESGSGDVRCRNCLVTGSTGAGILAVNSVDLWLENITLEQNSGDVPALEIDNTDTMPAGALGRVTIAQASITSESPTQPAVELKRTAASITGLATFGNNTGFIWQGENNGNFPSTLSHSTFSGTHCLHLVDHPDLNGTGNTIASTCTGNLEFENSQVNWSNLQDADGQTASPHLLTLDANSNLHLHQPQAIDVAGASLASGATIDVAWDLTVWAVNNFSNGIPMASINVSFTDFEPALQLYTNDLGYVLLPDFIGQRWTSSGPSSYNTVTSSCGYDSQSNSTSTVLDQDRVVYCLLPLDNQAPFIHWTTPEDGSIFPSQSEVEFNASESWDLDNDVLTFEWSSSIDGVFATQTDLFVANDLGSGIVLSDGIHQITLKICDPSHCVSETRTIELVNLAPVLAVSFEPALNPWSELIMPQTGTVTINTTGTYDPEGDDFVCLITFSGYNRQGSGWGNQWGCSEELTYTFDHVDDDPPASFTLTVLAFDEVGNNATYSVPVMLYNEIPDPVFTVERTSNDSASSVLLNGSGVVDPEGDGLTVTYTSSLDGVLSVGPLSWEGYLSRGVHTITMEVTDDRAEHANQSKSTSLLITVDNSVPHAVIDTPLSQTFESAELISFSANGSGDFDAACSSFPTDGDWVCAPFEPSGGTEYLVVTWTSDLDGRLTPEGQDWLLFEERLSAGTHTITLSVDDGIHEPVLAQRTVTIIASAPVLGLVSPLNGSQSLSSQTLMFDASQSVDYDDDAFTVTLRSSLHTEPLLVDVDPFNSHAFNLKAGQHTLTVTLTDENGDSRDETFVLTVVESEPTLVLISPENRASIEPGGVLRLEEASFDADNDLTVREWRMWSPQTSFPEVLSTSSIEELSGFAPGEYHLSLYVEDARGKWAEEHINITIQSSLPSLDRDSLSLSGTTFTQDELHRLTISIRLEDADGTTQDVRANLTLNIQQWEINLTDEDGDGIWEGVLEWRPESTGRPSLKIIAKDGQGETANVDVVTRSLVVEAKETDQRALILGASIAGLVAFVALLAFVLARRKRAIEDIDLLTSWDAFRAPASDSKTDGKDVPSLEENIMDGTEEVQATLEELD
ncbi:MAG: right-handed parallel beta-helix repeat-containing protein [Poseidonia sp.]